MRMLKTERQKTGVIHLSSINQLNLRKTFKANKLFY